MSALLKQVFSDSTSDHCSRFRSLANDISALAATVNIKIVPFHNENLEHFSKLDSDSRQNILNALQIYLNVYTAVKEEGASLLDSGRAVWNALAQLKYRPTSDLFSYISLGNVIEIHDDRLVQVFRNLAFFNYCSYSLEELYCFKLQELYARDIPFETKLMGYIEQLYGGAKSVIKTDLKTHTISELASQARLQIIDDIDYMAPLFPMDGGSKAVAFITIENAKVKNVEDFVSHTLKQSLQSEEAAVYSFKQPSYSAPEPST